MDPVPTIEIGDDDEKLAIYSNSDGTMTVVILKKKGSAKFTCQGTDYVDAHRKAFPVMGAVAEGEKAPETRMTF